MGRCICNQMKAHGALADSLPRWGSAPKHAAVWESLWIMALVHKLCSAGLTLIHGGSLPGSASPSALEEAEASTQLWTSYHTDPFLQPASNPGIHWIVLGQRQWQLSGLSKPRAEVCPGEKVSGLHPHKSQHWNKAFVTQFTKEFIFHFGLWTNAILMTLCFFICKVKFLLSSQIAFKISLTANLQQKGLAHEITVQTLTVVNHGSRLRGLAGYVRVKEKQLGLYFSTSQVNIVKCDGKRSSHVNYVTVIKLRMCKLARPWKI